MHELFQNIPIFCKTNFAKIAIKLPSALKLYLLKQNGLNIDHDFHQLEITQKKKFNNSDLLNIFYKHANSFFFK